MIVWVLIAAAAAALLWPSQSTLDPFSPAKPKGPSYMDAVAALQLVRARLAQTSRLDEVQQKALDSITLALSGGSDQ